MSLVERAGLALLRRIDPERAHGLALRALKSGLTPTFGPVTSSRLMTTLAGLQLPNPVGLAAGFDKNAEALGPLAQAGFGFLEVGAATPRPQPGNPKPRLFRLSRDSAAINRFGFNNDGADAISARLARYDGGVPIGLNLGANKDSADRADDFGRVLRVCGAHIGFATVNVSSPNTEALRDLQGKAALEALLRGVLEVRDGLSQHIPIFVKIAPDLTDEGLADIAQVASDVAIDGIIATNTTLSREGLTSADRGEAGGLSGAPLFEPSTRVLARLYRETAGTIPLIGVGGVGSAEQAYAKIKAGAGAVQLYTAMVFQGLSLASRIAHDLDRMLERDGVTNLSDVTGIEAERWAAQ